MAKRLLQQSANDSTRVSKPKGLLPPCKLALLAFLCKLGATWSPHTWGPPACQCWVPLPRSVCSGKSHPGGALGSACLLPFGAELRAAQTRPGEPGGSLGPCFMSRASSSFQLWPVGSEDQQAVWFWFWRSMDFFQEISGGAARSRPIYTVQQYMHLAFLFNRSMLALESF